MAADGCPGFVMEFNNYNISGYDSIFLTSSLQGVSQSRGLPKHHMATKGGLGFVVEFNIIWQPKATQNLLRNLTFSIYLEMTPCCLPLSCWECLSVEDHLNIIWQLQFAQELFFNLIYFGSQRLPLICCGI